MADRPRTQLDPNLAPFCVERSDGAAGRRARGAGISRRCNAQKPDFFDHWPTAHRQSYPFAVLRSRPDDPLAHPPIGHDDGAIGIQFHPICADGDELTRTSSSNPGAPRPPAKSPANLLGLRRIVASLRAALPPHPLVLPLRLQGLRDLSTVEAIWSNACFNDPDGPEHLREVLWKASCCERRSNG